MNNTPRLSFYRYFLSLLVLLLIIVALPATTGQGGEGPIPPPPPTWADSPFPPQLEADSPRRMTLSGCQNAPCQYLPLINRPPIDPHAGAMEIYNRLYVPSRNPSTGWYGNVSACQTSMTSAAFLTAMQQRINYFREMAGIPPITSLRSDYNTMVQASALMMSANNALSHSPPTDWLCYTTLGKDGAGSSNLFLGMYGTEAIDGYIRDPGDSNTAAGHRRWILLPSTTTMGTGDIPNGSQRPANALRVFDPSNWYTRPATRDTFVAWPPPGYVPYNTVYARWSFALPSADFSGSTVTVTRGGVGIPVTRFPAVTGYGENTLVWQINGMNDWDNWPKPAGDTAYTVTVQNVKINGVPSNYTYTVIVFDPGY